MAPVSQGPLLAGAFAPDHTVPRGGLDAWDAPDPSTSPSARLDSWLEVQVVAATGGWSRVLCANGWSAWVDGSALVALGSPAGPGAAVSAGGDRAESIGPTTWMAISGGVAVILSAVLPWTSIDLGGKTGAVSALKVPIELLWKVQVATPGQGAASPLTIGLALLLTGAIAVAVVFMDPALDVVRRAAGGLAVVIASDFVRQVSTVADQLNRPGTAKINVISLLGMGIYLALAGGALILIGTGRRPAVARA